MRAILMYGGLMTLFHICAAIYGIWLAKRRQNEHLE